MRQNMLRALLPAMALSVPLIAAAPATTGDASMSLRRQVPTCSAQVSMTLEEGEDPSNGIYVEAQLFNENDEFIDNGSELGRWRGQMYTTGMSQPSNFGDIGSLDTSIKPGLSLLGQPVRLAFTLAPKPDGGDGVGKYDLYFTWGNPDDPAMSFEFWDACYASNAPGITQGTCSFPCTAV